MHIAQDYSYIEVAAGCKMVSFEWTSLGLGFILLIELMGGEGVVQAEKLSNKTINNCGFYF